MWPEHRPGSDVGNFPIRRLVRCRPLGPFVARLDRRPLAGVLQTSVRIANYTELIELPMSAIFCLADKHRRRLRATPSASDELRNASLVATTHRAMSQKKRSVPFIDRDAPRSQMNPKIIATNLCRRPSRHDTRAHEERICVGMLGAPADPNSSDELVPAFTITESSGKRKRTRLDSTPERLPAAEIRSGTLGNSVRSMEREFRNRDIGAGSCGAADPS